MSVLGILKWPDPRLSQRCEPVGEPQKVMALAGEMLETMYDAPGRGLAAPQVGALIRLFVMDARWKTGEREPRIFINPFLTEFSDQRLTAKEGCLSIPGVEVPVERSEWVVMQWTAPDGTLRQERFEGFAATCVQHECDHLDGRVTFDRLSGADRARFETAYDEARQ